MNTRTKHTSRIGEGEGELLYFHFNSCIIYKGVNPLYLQREEDGGLNTHNSSLTSHLSILYFSPLKLSIN
jgi:hypothetical protein